MGCATKSSPDVDIIQTLNNAEHNMYSAKTLERKKVTSTTIGTIIETLHANSPIQAEHSKNVSRICERIGREINLPKGEIKRLREAAFLHDIGKIVLDENLIDKFENLTDNEQKAIEQHPIIGYRILNFFDGTVDLAEIILAHHERWDGTGYPKGLKGEEIPKLARIIKVADKYDAMINKPNSYIVSKEQAIEEIKRQAGSKYDPEIVDAFVKVVQS